ncbi:MAG: lipocalin-like domain-containing protein [Polaromonas sp.]|uniref:lipocalin-like domain-containing protein n=1 Tax=Polaromonas sp. TaxID=1869339 RepID=UPI00271CC360|nr:lipocalin-like domain-containing protein [Polaromonas sp.]MDO9112536.1 lipocalin-like domain-containing protein [Polaromonas sp.]MDP1887177.1 lipocalin-like domain-containing protein [Polaromonas sp.]
MRRRLLQALAAGMATGAGPAFALPARVLQFPRDTGAHPDFRTEWWYITGHANSGTREFGFQLTFFRSRVDGTQGMASRFSAKQLIFAHAAITDVAGNKLWHDQRIAREGFDIASASTQGMALKLRDWSLQSQGRTHSARLPATDFALNLQFTETQPLLLQGNQGLSRKGPEAKQASYYYSLPQLATSGSLQIKGQNFNVSGKAWLDHEWSEEILHPDATGWDWIGMNLDDGSALTAFRLRDKAGNTLWDGGSFRSAKGDVYPFSRGEVIFKPVRRWKSPLSQASYPVEWLVRTPADIYTVRAVIDNQELDSRQSTGAIYWEGLSELIDSNGKRVGRGYLEMTGYAAALRL